MYICTDCGALYEAEHRPYFVDRLPYGEGYIEHKFYSCTCGGDLVEAAICSACGEWKDAEELSHGICDKCGAALIRDARQVLKEQFSADEWAYLQQHAEEVI